MKLSTDITKQSAKYIERDENFNLYVKEIRATNHFSKEDERELIMRYKESEGDEKIRIRNKIIMSHQKFILSIVKKYANNTNVLDLINEANLGLINALEHFDLEYTQSLLAFAIFYIRRNIDEYIRKYDHQVCAYRSSSLKFRVRKTSEDLYKKLERTPTADEVASEMRKRWDNMPKKTPQNISYMCVDDKLDTDDIRRSAHLMDFNAKTSSVNSYEDNIKEDDNKYKVSILIEKLSTKEKDVIGRYYGLNGQQQQSLSEIATKMDLTKERVRQIVSKSLIKMQNKGRGY